jgi:hypothetical protein
MTLDIYSHVFPNAERDATATLDRLLSRDFDQRAENPE